MGETVNVAPLRGRIHAYPWTTRYLVIALILLALIALHGGN